MAEFGKAQEEYKKKEKEYNDAKAKHYDNSRRRNGNLSIDKQKQDIALKAHRPHQCS
jgi:hypothetical protein